MAFTKTKNPIWYVDGTYASVATDLYNEKIRPEHILFAVKSDTAGQVVVFVRKGEY